AWTRSSPCGANDARLEDGVEAREGAREVRVAAGEQRLLVPGPDAAAGGLAVAGIERVHRLHSLHHLSEGREALRVESVRVVAQAHEDLRGAAVGHGEGEGDRPTAVRLARRVVGDGALPPARGDPRVAVDPELRPSAGDHAEEAGPVVVARVD